MREWKRLKVPVEPEKTWEWMKDCFEFCKLGHGDEIPCAGTNCEDCIYSRLHADARASLYNESLKQEKKMFEWEGLKVPVDPKREWGSWMCGEGCCPGTSIGIKCGHGKEVDCSECIYARRHHGERRCFYEQWYGKWNQAPKLTAEVFDRPDCPEWARWAAVDACGAAYWYEECPNTPLFCDTRWHPIRLGSKIRSCSERFDAADWEHSLIERPAKELPKLTQTAFHCPDCPKETAKLKVFPANHVVALDKDDKVLGVMELQCKEGEVKKSVSKWVYGLDTDRLYRTDDYRCNVPEVSIPVIVSYFKPETLTGKAVTSYKTGESFLIYSVSKGDEPTVGLRGVAHNEACSMDSLIMLYHFANSTSHCCIWHGLQ